MTMAETKPSMGLGLPSSYPPVAMLPTQVGPSGVRYDFNTGCRVTLPIRESGVWRVVMRDLDTNNILFDHETQGAEVNSTKRWFVRFALDVWEIDGATKSLVLYSQMVGRAIRGKTAGGNEKAEIVTVVDTALPGFGDLSKAFTNWEDVW